MYSKYISTHCHRKIMGKFCLCQHYVFSYYLMNQTNLINFFSISGPRVNLAKTTTSSSPNHNNLELVMTEDPDFIRTEKKSFERLWPVIVKKFKKKKKITKIFCPSQIFRIFFVEKKILNDILKQKYSCPPMTQNKIDFLCFFLSFGKKKISGLIFDPSSKSNEP